MATLHDILSKEATNKSAIYLYERGDRWFAYGKLIVQPPLQASNSGKKSNTRQFNKSDTQWSD